MTTINFKRVGVVLLFAITFTILGTSAPILYATYVPQESIIELHSFEAQDTTVNAEEHDICFDRTVHQPATGERFTQLYLIDNSGTRVEIESSSIERYFREGRDEVITRFELPENIPEGKYRYLLVLNMDLADGRVSRTFTYTSQTFEVVGENETTSRDPITCSN